MVDLLNSVLEDSIPSSDLCGQLGMHMMHIHTSKTRIYIKLNNSLINSPLIKLVSWLFCHSKRKVTDPGSNICEQKLLAMDLLFP